jgi:hypothetical protein
MSHTSTPVVNNMVNGTVLGKAPLARNTVPAGRAAMPAETTSCYLAVSPDGKKIAIPQELFVALSDFLKTRKCPGSVTIDFRCDEIVGIEALTKKRFPSKL